MEIESALVSHPAVAEAAVVGRPDELKGSAVAAFVTLEAGAAGRHLLHRRAAQKPAAVKSYVLHSAVPGQWANHHGGHQHPWRMPRCWSGCGGCWLGGFPFQAPEAA